MQIFYSPFAIPIVAIIAVFGWMSVAAVADSVRKIVKNRDEIQLKQMLADRGMSADEIERIVAAPGQESEV